MNISSPFFFRALSPLILLCRFSYIRVIGLCNLIYRVFSYSFLIVMLFVVQKFYVTNSSLFLLTASRLWVIEKKFFHSKNSPMFSFCIYVVSFLKSLIHLECTLVFVVKIKILSSSLYASHHPNAEYYKFCISLLTW